MKKSLSVLLLLTLACLCTTSMMAQTPFDHQDVNGDGKLSRSEFKGPPKAFNRMDANNDGYISRKEAEGTRLAGGGKPKPEVPPPSGELIYVDTHNHLVGRQAEGGASLDRSALIALESMNATGVKLNLLLPMPQTVSQKMRLRFEEFLPVIKQHPGRFSALGGGGTLNVMIQQAILDGKVTAAMEKEFDARALELVQKGAAGFGEMTAEHFSMDADHPYETAPPDHPLFLRLADLAAKHGLPIDMHMEAIPEAMPMPSRFQSPPNPTTLKPNIASFGRLLAHNRKAKIIWVHLGWDNTGKRTIDLTRTLLAENANLYISLRIASGMKERKVVSPTFPLDANGQLKAEWLVLFEEFPDRFLVGSDEIIKPANDHPSAGSIRSTVGLLEQLPTKLRSRVGYENAYGIYNVKK